MKHNFKFGRVNGWWKIEKTSRKEKLLAIMAWTILIGVWAWLKK